MKNVFILLFLSFLSSPLFCSFPILCEGRTEITYEPAGPGDSVKKILCYSPIEIDWEKKELRCDVDMKKVKYQIQVIDGNKHLFANHLYAKFQSKGNQIKLENLSLFGNVRLIQQEETDDQQTVHTQYVLADYLDYTQYPDELLISSDPENQVYYYDDLNEYEMNASQLLLKRNPLNHKMKIQGMGPVHFSFKESYLQDIKDQMTRKKKKSS